MAKLAKLHKQEIDFINEYVSINMPRYKEMVRHIFPDIAPISKEIKADFGKIYEGRELQLAVDYARGIAYNMLSRRLH